MSSTHWRHTTAILHYNSILAGLHQNCKQRADRNQPRHQDTQDFQEVRGSDGPAAAQVQHHRLRVQREVDESDQESSEWSPSCW